MPLLDDINAIVRAEYLPAVANQIWGKIVLFTRAIASGKRIDWRAGTEIRKVVVLGKYRTQRHDRQYLPLEVDTSDITTYGVYNVISEVVNLAMTDKDKDRLTGPTAVVDFLKTKLYTAEISLRQSIEENLIFNDFLKNAVNNSAGATTYAGLSRTSFPEWEAQVDDGGGVNRPLTRQLMSKMYTRVAKDKDVPTCIITTPELWSYIESTIIGEKDRFSDTEMLKLGHPNIMFMGSVPIFRSDYCPANTVYFLNENYFEFVLHKDAEQNGFKFDDFQKVPQRTFSTAHLWFIGTIACIRCNAQGVLKNVTAG